MRGPSLQASALTFAEHCPHGGTSQGPRLVAAAAVVAAIGGPLALAL